MEHFFDLGQYALNMFFTAHQTFGLAVPAFKFQVLKDSFALFLYLIMWNGLLQFWHSFLKAFSLTLLLFLDLYYCITHYCCCITGCFLRGNSRLRCRCFFDAILFSEVLVYQFIQYFSVMCTNF